MYEPITVEIDRGHSDGAYSSTPINFTGRLLETVEEGHTTIRLYEWADRGRLAYLVHVEEGKPGWPPGAPSTRSSTPTRPGPPPRRATPPTPTKGYTAKEVSRAYPEFAGGRFGRSPRSAGS